MYYIITVTLWQQITMYQIGEFNGEKHRKNPLQFTSRKQNHNDYTIE